MIPCSAAARLWSLPFPDFHSSISTQGKLVAQEWLERHKNYMRALHTRITCAKVGPHLFASAQRAEVLDGLGHGLAVESHDDAPRGLAADVDIEEDLVKWLMLVF